jgi:hypothetical protein
MARGLLSRHDSDVKTLWLASVISANFKLNSKPGPLGPHSFSDRAGPAAFNSGR